MAKAVAKKSAGVVKCVALVAGRYGVSNVEKGGVFECSPAYARIWVALGKAQLADGDTVEVPASGKAKSRNARPPAEGAADAKAVADPMENVDVPALREEYHRLTGTLPDGRWSTRRLAEKVAEARATYSTRAMSADTGHNFG